MNSQNEEKVLCLAALLQQCKLVDQLATAGSANTEELDTCLQQLFIFDHEHVSEAFGGVANLVPGLQLLLDLLDQRAEGANRNVLNYTIGLLHLERKVSKNSAMLKTIRSRLEHASFKINHFDSNDSNIAISLAGIYQDTLSTLKYRIQVNGNMQHLHDDFTANRIRALLLAGMRSARFWRMVGGSRLDFVFKRSAYADTAKALLQQHSR